MKRLATTAQMRELDRIAIEDRQIPSLDLMEYAAGAVAEKVLQLTEKQKGDRRITVFCGPGNNGGDGVAAARLLMQRGCEVRVYLVGDRRKMTRDALAMEQKLILAGGKLEDYVPDSSGQQEWIRRSACMVDALFGVGLKRAVTGDFLAAVRRMNGTPCPVVSCDIPSGIDGDTGSVLGEAVRADCTVTFTCSKYGLERGVGYTYAGTVEMAQIGIPEELVDRVLGGIFPDRLSIDTGDWQQIFSACLGKMMAIQTACGEIVVKGQDWNVDFSEGTIRFGNRAYPIQFLGSESALSNTWLWGWENINGFSDELLRLARQTKEMGERWMLEPLTTAEFALDDTFHGHSLSIAACGLAEKYCYYRGPHAQGAVFVAFSGVPDDVFAPVDLHRFLSLTTQCIRKFPLDHKIFVEGFLSWNHTDYEWHGHTLTAHFGEDLTIGFEQVNETLHICSMTNR